MFMHQLRLSLAFKQDLTMNFMIHWLCTGSCHRDAFLSHPYHVPYRMMTTKLTQISTAALCFLQFYNKISKESLQLVYCTCINHMHHNFTKFFSTSCCTTVLLLFLFFFYYQKFPHQNQKAKIGAIYLITVFRDLAKRAA